MDYRYMNYRRISVQIRRLSTYREEINSSYLELIGKPFAKYYHDNYDRINKGNINLIMTNIERYKRFLRQIITSAKITTKIAFEMIVSADFETIMLNNGQNPYAIS